MSFKIGFKTDDAIFILTIGYRHKIGTLNLALLRLVMDWIFILNSFEAQLSLIVTQIMINSSWLACVA